MIYTLTLNPALDITVATDLINKERANKTILKSIAIGGKGFNTSRTLNCLGARNAAIAFCGGLFSGNMEKMLKKEKINSKLISIKNNTRVNIKVIEKKSKKMVEFNEEGPVIGQDELESLLHVLKEIGAGAGYFVISGSLPGNVEAGLYKRIIGILKKEKIRILLDASGLPLYHGIGAVPDIVKVNQHEIYEICNKYYNAEQETVIGNLINMGIKAIMVTNGPYDTFYYDSTGKYCIKSPDIEGPYKTGAGDAVNAGLIFALQKGYSTERRLKFASACGNANILSEIPGEINVETVHELMPKIKVKKERD